MASFVFMAFIEKFPKSSSAEEWRKYGNDIPKHSGHFTCYLFAGDIYMALNHADMTNRACLKELLFPTPRNYNDPES